MTTISENKCQSDILTAIRFPLIVLVVFIHTVPNVFLPIPIEFSSAGFYVWFTELVSHNIGRIAVPMFFLISGYFFFYKTSVNDWSIAVYGNLLYKRIRTLLLPYILWNTIYWGLVYLKNVCSLSLYPYEQTMLSSSWYSLFIDGPVVYPLWYLRDLIAMCLISPIIFIVLRYLRIVGVLILFIGYVMEVESGIPGFSSTAIFYFTFGAYLGLYKENMLMWAKRFRYIAVSIVLLFLGMLPFLNQYTVYEYLVRFYIPFGCIVLLDLMRILYDKRPLQINRLKNLSKYVFFVYAVHTIYLINWISAFYGRILPQGYIGGLISYLLVVPTTIGICILLYKVMERVLPKCLSLLVGGRT